MFYFLNNEIGSGSATVTTNIGNATCGGAAVLRVIKFIMQLLNIIFIIVPIVLILLLIIDFGKNVIAKDSGDMSKNLQIAIKRLLLCIVLFLIPTIITASIKLLGNLGVDFANCIDIATTGNIDNYEINYDGIEDKGVLNNKTNQATISEDDDASKSSSSNKPED